MYVEITGRQTGKTTRLIDSIVDFLKQNPDKTALIVTKSESSRKLIQEKVNIKCGRPCEYRTITSYKMLPPKENTTIKQFVDEFGFIEELELDTNAYYNGSVPFWNEKAIKIWDYYREIQSLKPNNILKRHKM